MLVLGGPGSGKTTLSLLKSRQLISDLRDGQEVLFLSFSRAAVRQVLIRCRDILVGSERKRIAVKTYHAFCLELLRSHGRLLNGRQARIMYPAAASIQKRELGDDWPDEEARLAADDGVYSFDQFAPAVARLLGEAEAVAELLASRYPVIILDEFQDTSDDQWDLIRQLARRSRLVFLADPDQRIFDYDERVNAERLDQLRALLNPAEYNLGFENHRSPSGGILGYARAVLRNEPLPTTPDVQTVAYWPKQFAATVHAAVAWTFSKLRESGVETPSVAVLTRTNGLAAQVSDFLSEAHVYKSQTLKPVEHDLVWDAHLTAAAAQVVASILEWPELTPELGVAATMDKIADYFELKNAGKETKAAAGKVTRYRDCADSVRGGASLRTPKDATGIQRARAAGIELVGDPASDWVRARSVLDGPADLKDVFQSARAVRLFRATDEIGGRLKAQWDRSGTYGHATQVVRRALEASMVGGDRREPRGCVVMTMHKSKGKEFDGVVLVEDQFKAPFFNDRDGKDKPLYPAARRLLMVGMTRARQRVVIVRPRGAVPLTNPALGRVS